MKLIVINIKKINFKTLVLIVVNILPTPKLFEGIPELSENNI